jgi:hypothetical protein
MTKLDKLKEVNTMINNVLMEMEARIFIENIEDVRENRDRKITEEQPKVAIELK